MEKSLRGSAGSSGGHVECCVMATERGVSSCCRVRFPECCSPEFTLALQTFVSFEMMFNYCTFLVSVKSSTISVNLLWFSAYGIDAVNARWASVLHILPQSLTQHNILITIFFHPNWYFWIKYNYFYTQRCCLCAISTFNLKIVQTVQEVWICAIFPNSPHVSEVMTGVQNAVLS